MGLYDDWHHPKEWTPPKDLQISFLKPGTLDCMQSWVDLNPGWQYKLWDRTDVDELLKKYPQVRQCGGVRAGALQGRRVQPRQRCPLMPGRCTTPLNFKVCRSPLLGLRSTTRHGARCQKMWSAAISSGALLLLL